MAKKWMQKAFSKNKGSLHRALGVPEGETIPAGKLKSAAHSKSGLMRKRANLAMRGKEASRKKKGKKGAVAGMLSMHYGSRKG